jgi:hypothetical protein
LSKKKIGSKMSSSAASSTMSSTAVPSVLSVAVSEKLTKVNYPLWSAQVMPVIRAAQLNDLLVGADLPPEKEITLIIDNKPVKSRNPAYSAWVAWDITARLMMLYFGSSLAYTR